MNVVLLAVCIFLAFLPSYAPLYDGMPTVGDESMSLSQSYNVVRSRTPGYGYTADTQPWTPGLAILPTYFAIYGPVMAVVAPLRRIPVARHLSRLLVGGALFIGALTVLRNARRRVGGDAKKTDKALAMAAVATLALLFCGASMFVHVASCARVDATGVFFIAAFGYAARRFLEERTERKLAIVGACASVAFFASYIAGAICALDAIVLGVFHIVTPFELRKLGRTLAVGFAVVAGTVLAYLVVHFVVLHGEARMPVSLAFSGETDLVKSRLGNVEASVLIGRLALFTGVMPIFLLVVIGSMLVASGLPARRASEAGFGLLVGRIATIPIAIHFVEHRAAYAPLIVCAMVVPFLDVVVRARGALVRRTLVIAALACVVYALVPNVFTRSAELRRDDAINAQLNARRDAHVASLFAFMDREHIASALTTDPLLTILDSDQRRFLFLYAADVTGTSEIELLRRFEKRFLVHHLVTTRFGDEGFVNYLGPQAVRAWTTKNRHGATELHYPDGSVVRVEAVFQSTAPDVPEGREYGFDPEPPCTPFFVYRIEIEGGGVR